MSHYPDEIATISRSPIFCGAVNEANASSKAASFICGSIIQFSLLIDAKTKTISNARFSTNGCGYMIAAAECLAKRAIGTNLTDLGGSNEFVRSVFLALGNVADERSHCLETVSESFRAALADYRKRTIEEFIGEKALICTCFGVSEDAILDLIETHNAQTIDAVSAACNAGSGCGSCQMMIQELIDSRAHTS